MSVRLVTNLGELWIRLHVKEAPNTCTNFLKLCKIKYYYWCIFHQVQKNFIAQCGDPTGLGGGGQALSGLLGGAPYLPDELCRSLKHGGKGVVGMVNAGKDRNASQFYITLGDRPLDYLDGQYTIFGQVVGGMEVLDRINASFLDPKGRPLEDIFIRKIIIDEDPFPDPPGLTALLPDRSPPPSQAFTQMRRPRQGEEDPREAGMTEAEKEERRKDEIARSRAITLEILGDRPSADVEAPQNVLFVCKLNPITTSDDLKTIFARFGTILSCEVVKDRRTGQSLCYAFIEFDSKEACDEAYLKMNNVIIDDRRIRVDFSQSLSKVNRGHKALNDSRRESSSAPHRGEHRKDRDSRHGDRKDHYGHGRDSDRDYPRRDYKDKDSRRDSRRDYSRDHSRDYRRDHSRDYSRDHSRDSSRRTSRSRSPLRK